MYVVSIFINELIYKIKMFFKQHSNCNCKTLLYLYDGYDAIGHHWKVYRCTNCNRFMYQLTKTKGCYRGRFIEDVIVSKI